MVPTQVTRHDGRMASICSPHDQHLELTVGLTGSGAQKRATPSRCSRVTGTGRDRVSVDLRGLGERLRSEAAKRHLTTAALTRRAVVQLLDEHDPSASGQAGDLCARTSSRAEVKVTVRMSLQHAASLAARARAVDQAQGRYVSALLDGLPPAPRAADHAAAVAALMASTDGVAALSADLNAFLRVLGRAQLIGLERYRETLASLNVDVRRHLETAAALMVVLAPTRKVRQ